MVVRFIMPPLRRQSFSTGRLLPAIHSQQQRAQQQELSFPSVIRAQGTELLLLSRRHPPPVAPEPSLRALHRTQRNRPNLPLLEDADAIQLALSDVVLAL